MHGSVQRENTSCRSSRISCSRHMRSVPPLVTKKSSLVIDGDHNLSLTSSTVTTSSSDSFLKDGRKICVGDSALFKPTQDSPPYIGLIRWLKYSEENHLKLGVNWLYRPSEIKLGKVTLVEGEPNEIFYSFHEDVIPAESLLHPCKVAFLPRGVGLPAGTSSFVCRRVYDITNKCLWWLTDQDYVNDRQEHVDQLLYRTRVEMHAPLQSGGRSPKQVNGPTSSSQVNSASESGHNNTVISSHSQMKGKKREKLDHGTELLKKERCSRSDDNDSIQCRTESNLKSEVARITDRGGLVDLDGVEKLVQLMQHDKTEKKMDLGSRSILAGVMAGTDKTECLNRFVQLRGLPVFDEWLQDVHKGKIGDTNSLKDSNTVDEFLLVLLRALDKLPVDLQALQMCNIGRSVNHLRTHKNSEIQRKARSLVDTWKKRVEAEMITNEAKSGSAQAVSGWPSKSRITEATHSGSRTPTSSDAAIKTSITQTTLLKTNSARSSHVDSNVKSTTSSPGHGKAAHSPLSVKESIVKVPIVASPDAPIIREDRSSSSNQSSSGKDEAKSTVTGVVTVNKMFVAASRNRKESGFPGIAGTVQKEMSLVRNSSKSKNVSLERSNHSASSTEKVLDLSATEGSIQKLIVKIPNGVPSSAQGFSGEPREDFANTSSRVSSPEQFDRASEKSDLHPSNVASEINDAKDVQNVSAETSMAPLDLPDEGKSMMTDSRKLNPIHSANSLKSSKMHASSFSPMNALMSCVKYSEANSSLSMDDDVGMHLLASVAAGEISRSDLLSPTESTERSTPAVKDSLPDDEARSKSISENNVTALQGRIIDDSERDTTKPRVFDSTPKETSVDAKPASSHAYGDLIISDDNKLSVPSNTDTRSKVGIKRENSEKSKDNICTISPKSTVSAEKLQEGEFASGSVKEKCTSSYSGTNGISDVKICGFDGKSSVQQAKSENLKATDSKPIIESTSSHPFCEGDNKNDATDEMPAFLTSNGNNVVESGDKVTDICASRPDGLNFDTKMDRISTGMCLSSNEEGVDIQSKKKLEHAPELRGSDSLSVQPNESQNCSGAPIFAQASSSAGLPEIDAKVEFDLNEGFTADEGKYGEPISLGSSNTTTTVHMMNSLAFSVNPITSSHSSSITVAAAAKGPFVPPDDLLKSKGEFGWRGSAATSAFRPAEPRKVTKSLTTQDDSSSKQARITLDIDLNVPDEGVLEEMASQHVFGMKTGFLNEPSVSGSFRGSGGLDLDLNKVDDAGDIGNFSQSSHLKRKIASVQLKQFDGLASLGTRKDLDLNDRPGTVDSNADHYSVHQQIKLGIPSTGLRMNSPGQGSFSSWFPPGNSYSTIAIPSMFPERVEHPFPVFPPNATTTQRTFGPSSVMPFTPELYRGSVLSSSPAVPYPSNTFQLPLFAFGETYPLPSVGTTSYVDSTSGARLFGPQAVHSQLLRPVPPQFQRSYMIPSLPENTNNARWGRQGFDLNAGPGAIESNEAREEMFQISSSGQNSSLQNSQEDQQTRIYSVSGGNLMKRKEPEGGWDNDSFGSKQSSWQ